MTPTKSGAYCAACQKEVVDFSLMTDKEIKAYFKQVSGKTCGRFKHSQLNKEYRDKILPQPFWKWPIAALTGLVWPALANGQDRNPEVYDASNISYTDGKAHDNAEYNYYEVQLLKRDDSLALPGISYNIVGTDEGGYSNTDGLIVLHTEDKRPVELTLKGFGYLTDTVFLKQGINIVYLDVNPEEDICVRAKILPSVTQVTYGTVAVVKKNKWYSPRTWWWKIRSVFQ